MAAPGCAPAVGPPGQRSSADVSAKPSVDRATDNSATDDVWDVFYLQDAKIGYAHTTVRPIERGGRPLVEVDVFNHLEVSRFGQTSQQELKSRSLETPEGQLLEFSTEVSFGPSPTVTTGRVEGNQLVLEVRTAGASQARRLPWSDAVRGFYGVEKSLERQPLAPGENRRLKVLMPVINEVADVELSAGDLETTSVLGVGTRLLRVESVARLGGGNSINSTLWTDPQGRTIKTSVESMRQASYRTTREVALARPSGRQSFDLGFDLIVKLDKPLPHPRDTRRVRYRVELADGDPSKRFATGPTQAVRAGPARGRSDRHAHRSCRAARPGQPAAGRGARVPGRQQHLADRRPAHPRHGPRGEHGAEDPCATAIALERYVYKTLKKNDFSQAFATAAEVAQTHEGDCSEHAVLLAALARACGIPSRVAIGLVYVEGAGGFGYHMWTEMYLSGTWVPFDAVSGRGGTSAAYLKLADSSLDGPGAYSSFLPVAQVVGQLKIGLISAE